MSADMSVIGLLLEASIPVQIVMLLLIGASLVSWSIIFTKRRLLRRTEAASDEFEAAFWSGGDRPLATPVKPFRSSISMLPPSRVGLPAAAINCANMLAVELLPCVPLMRTTSAGT